MENLNEILVKFSSDFQKRILILIEQIIKRLLNEIFIINYKNEKKGLKDRTQANKGGEF